MHNTVLFITQLLRQLATSVLLIIEYWNQTSKYICRLYSFIGFILLDQSQFIRHRASYFGWPTYDYSVQIYLRLLRFRFLNRQNLYTFLSTFIFLPSVIIFPTRYVSYCLVNWTGGGTWSDDSFIDNYVYNHRPNHYLCLRSFGTFRSCFTIVYLLLYIIHICTFEQ